MSQVIYIYIITGLALLKFKSKQIENIALPALLHLVTLFFNNLIYLYFLLMLTAIASRLKFTYIKQVSTSWSGSLKVKVAVIIPFFQIVYLRIDCKRLPYLKVGCLL